MVFYLYHTWSVFLVFLHTSSHFCKVLICSHVLENWLSKSKQSCLLGFTNLLPIPVVFLPNFKFFYQTLSNLEPNFSIFLTAFGKLLPRLIYWHWRNNLKLNFSMLTRKISTVNTFGTLLLTVHTLGLELW